jgi:hypothetical protein
MGCGADEKAASILGGFASLRRHLPRLAVGKLAAKNWLAPFGAASGCAG